MLRALAIAALLTASPALGQTVPAEDSGVRRYSLHQAGDRTFVIDSVSGAVWRWVWRRTPGKACEPKPGEVPGSRPDCMDWYWQRTVFDPP